MSLPIIIEVAAHTDTGCIRSQNEDAFLVGGHTSAESATIFSKEQAARGPVLLVVDGMGGAAAGEVASRIAVEAVRDYDAAPDAATFVAGALHAANRAVQQAARSGEGGEGMGAAATLALPLADRVVIGQVGDSRAYLFRAGRLTSLTRDQSIVGQLVAAGEITEAEARRHPQRNIITQSLGTGKQMQPVLTSAKLAQGDVLLLCSDGLSGVLEDEEIAAVLATMPDLAEACRELIQLVNERGGPDNVTVILARFLSPELLETREPPVVEPVAVPKRARRAGSVLYLFGGVVALIVAGWLIGC